MNSERYFREMKNLINARRLSEKTYTAYSIALGKFFDYFSAKDHPVNVNCNEIIEYLASISRTHPAQQKQAIAALRFFYTNIMKQPEKLKVLKYPKWKRRIPNVLDRDFVVASIQAVKNKRAKAIIATLYGTGIRLAELCHLRTTDIDSKRMIIVIHEGKGGKDRIVQLPPVLLEWLRDYWQSLPDVMKHTNAQWLFPGEKVENYISPATVQRLCREVLDAHPHQLRHSYATYLHEQGENMKIIGDILGHTSTRTTEIYLHTSNAMIKKAINPLAA